MMLSASCGKPKAARSRWRVSTVIQVHLIFKLRFQNLEIEEMRLTLRTEGEQSEQQGLNCMLNPETKRALDVLAPIPCCPIAC